MLLTSFSRDLYKVSEQGRMYICPGCRFAHLQAKLDEKTPAQSFLSESDRCGSMHLYQRPGVQLPEVYYSAT